MEAPVTRRTWKGRAISLCVLTLGLAAASLSGAADPQPKPCAIIPSPAPTPTKPKPREPIQLGPSCVTAESHSDVGKGRFTHGPVNLRQCEPSHLPHSSMQKKLLAQNASDLCISCHSKAIETKTRVLSDIGAQINNSKYLHGPVGQKNCLEAAGSGQRVIENWGDADEEPGRLGDDQGQQPIPDCFWTLGRKGDVEAGQLQ